jgi:sugar lactone lactonase YvrE
VIDVYAHQEDSLGEGVLWDGETVWWVDIIRGLVHRGPDTTFEIGGPVGSLALIEGGRIGLALRTHLALLDPSDGTIDPWVEIESDRPANRLNDGRVDRSGRWWVGSMDAGAVGETGALYRVEAGVVTRIFDQLAIPNSLAVSPGNDFLYFTQTVNRIIFRFKLRPDGDLGSGHRFVEVAGPGVPDGACVDEDGCLWSAEWGGGRVVRYTPAGVVDRVITLPVSNVTCPAFGGPDLDTLFVTTARAGLDPEALDSQPLAGSVFAVDAGVRGLPEPKVTIP